jgi:hypothetical protein
MIAIRNIQDRKEDEAFPPCALITEIPDKSHFNETYYIISMVVKRAGTDVDMS